MIRSRLYRVAVASVTATLLQSNANAQEPAARQGNSGDLVGVAAVNVFLGASMGAISAALRGESIMPLTAQGAAGGGAMFLGKYSAAHGFAAGGRVMHALGTELVASALRKDDTLCLTVPVVLLRVAIRCSQQPPVAVDLLSVVGAVLFVVEGATLDVEATVTTLTLTFQDSGHMHRSVAATLGGTIVYQEAEDPRVSAARIRHEMVHVLQHDAGQWLVSRPIEAALRSVVQKRVGESLRYVQLGVHSALFWTLRFTPADPRAPFETEARSLTRR